MPPALEARGLRKAFAGTTVVDGVDLRCEAGSVLGLLGPNGAGKTTTLRMLYGFLAPDAGAISYAGRDFAGDRTGIKRSIGVCAQEDNLDTDFTVIENLRRRATCFRPRVPDLDARVRELLDRFALADRATAKPDELSGGYRRRLMIACAVVHRPAVLFLDEPSTGLDPAARLEVWRLVDELRRDGLAVVMTTHYMDEAERLSDRVLVLAKGRVLTEGTPREVVGTVLGEHLVVLPPEARDQAAILAWAAGAGVTTREVLGELRLTLRAGMLATFAAAFPAARYTVREPTLDDLFLELAGAR